jgi:hypothetical protein
MNNFDNCKATFSRLLPDLSRLAESHFRYLGPEAKEEAVQNSIALAWKSFASLVEQGRGEEPGIIKSALRFSIKRTKAGRTMPNNDDARKPTDVYRNVQRGQVRFEHGDLNHFVDDQTPVPDQVSFRLDVPAFLDSLGERKRRMAEALMEGERTDEVARQFDVTPAAVSQFRNRFRELFENFMAG